MLRMCALHTASILLIAAHSYAGDTGSADILTTTSERVDVRSDGAKPFQLDADFTAQTNRKLEGHLTWKWNAKDLWSQEIRMGEYRQRSVRKGDILYVSRNAPFTPLRIIELQDLLTVFSAGPGSKPKKVKHQAQNGIDAECVELEVRADRHAWNPKRTICINAATNDLLSEEIKDDDEYRLKEFSDYQAFREHSYPDELKLLVNGSVALKVSINSLREGVFDEAAFVPSPGAIARRQCEHMIPPKALKTPDPAYPRSAAQNGLGGLSIVALTVLPDGSVENVQLIGSAGHAMDQVTQEIVSN